MSDPAEAAAQRAWDANQLSTWPSQNAVAGAEEALKPIRELHRRVEIDVCTCSEDCEIHEDECPLDAKAPICRECWRIAEGASPYFAEDGGWQDFAGWPCDTAKLVYTTEELNQ